MPTHKIEGDVLARRNKIFELWIRRAEERTGFSRFEFLSKGRKREFVMIRMYLVHKLKSYNLWKCIELGEKLGEGRDWSIVNHYLEKWESFLENGDSLALDLIEIMEAKSIKKQLDKTKK